MAANTAMMREMSAFMMLNPILNSDVLFGVDDLSCFNKRGELLAFIK
jgi:hypothetical protein